MHGHITHHNHLADKKTESRFSENKKEMSVILVPEFSPDIVSDDTRSFYRSLYKYTGHDRRTFALTATICRVIP